MSGDSGKATPSDRRLIEHVLEGQQALAVSVSELHLIVAQYHGEAMKANALTKQSCDYRDEKTDALDGEVKAASHRLATLERKLVVINTAYAAALLALGAVWAVYGDTIKKAVTGDATEHGSPAAANSKG
jgi:hypothetical protein